MGWYNDGGRVMDDYRENIWGIRPEDRRWFQLLTLAGGIAGSVILTLLELDSMSGDMGQGPSEVARNVVLGIGASFAASGFIAWGLLQIKELTMPIGDWIREANERRRERLRREGMQIGYKMGYADSQAGKPPSPPSVSDDKPQESRDNESGAK